jgi:hypothetical protein
MALTTARTSRCMFYQLVVLYIEDRGHTTNLSTTTLGPPYARSRREASRGTAWSLAPIRVNSAKRECDQGDSRYSTFFKEIDTVFLERAR